MTCVDVQQETSRTLREINLMSYTSLNLFVLIFIKFNDVILHLYFGVGCVVTRAAMNTLFSK